MRKGRKVLALLVVAMMTGVAPASAGPEDQLPNYGDESIRVFQGLNPCTDALHKVRLVFVLDESQDGDVTTWDYTGWGHTSEGHVATGEGRWTYDAAANQWSEEFHWVQSNPDTGETFTSIGWFTHTWNHPDQNFDGEFPLVCVSEAA